MAPFKVVTVGAAFSANKGAGSMLQGLIDALPTVVRTSEICVLSTYPEADRRANPNSHVDVVSLTPRQLVFPVLPLALLIWVARRLGGTGHSLAITPALRRLIEADVVADLAGISFVDGRGIPILVYNVLMTGVPLLVGTPTVKCSQALGPIEAATTRIAARLVLPRLVAIAARGETTMEYLENLGLENARLSSDLAFLMHETDEASIVAEESLRFLSGRRFVTVAPSAVVDGYCRAVGIDYVGVLARLCDRIVTESGLAVVLLAHSVRPGNRRTRMNDLPVCVEIVSRVDAKEDVRFLERSLTPAALRAVIGRSEFLVSSRFHAMISALTTSTPVLVVGWSHKYAEVLRQFNLERWTMAYDRLSENDLYSRFLELAKSGDEVADGIRTALPEARRGSMVSIELLTGARAQSPHVR